jgi:uncharacterized membrane protein HdeD (DUF308 family)
MIEKLQKNWWLLAVRGILAILFGIAALLSPVVLIYSLLTFFSFFVILSGFFVITLAFLGESENRWLRVFEGLFFIATGALVLFNPAFIVSGFMILVAVWAIVSGIFYIIGAIRLRKFITNEWYMIFNGVISIIFGIILAGNLITGAAIITMLFGIYAIINGLIFIVFSFKIKNFKLG